MKKTEKMERILNFVRFFFRGSMWMVGNRELILCCTPSRQWPEYRQRLELGDCIAGIFVSGIMGICCGVLAGFFLLGAGAEYSWATFGWLTLLFSFVNLAFMLRKRIKSSWGYASRGYKPRQLQTSSGAKS